MEASLAAVADAGVDIRHALFDRFFAAFPDRRASFMILDASSRRMTDETLQMMLGLAKGESWVWPLVAELVFTHRAYGALPIEEYDAFIDKIGSASVRERVCQYVLISVVGGSLKNKKKKNKKR